MILYDPRALVLKTNALRYKFLINQHLNFYNPISAPFLPHFPVFERAHFAQFRGHFGAEYTGNNSRESSRYYRLPGSRLTEDRRRATTSS